MGFLAGKRILVTGVLSNRSIAYGIARACHQQGAELAFTYVGDRFRNAWRNSRRSSAARSCCPATWPRTARSRRPSPNWAPLGRPGRPGALYRFRPREAIAGDFLDGLSREAFRVAHDISAYSFPAMAKAALPLMQGRNASVLTLTYLGAERVVPNYNTMGLAKASLEASVRYLATALGPRGIRANGISAGPIKTLAASGIKDFSAILKFVEAQAPLRRNVTIEDVGNVAAFLLSDLAAGVTGEITHVDAGFSTVVPGMED